MNILAISGSLRKKSYNTALLRCIKLTSSSINLSIYDDLAIIPPFDPEVSDEALPTAVIDLRSRVAHAEGIIISTPEYAYRPPGVLKNALDWLVSSGEVVLKPVLVMSVSTSELGGLRAHNSLVITLNAMNAKVIVEGSLCVPFAKSKFDTEGELVDPLTRESLMVSLSIFERSIRESK